MMHSTRALFFIHLLWSIPSFATESTQARPQKILAQWQMVENRMVLLINIADQLSQKQQRLISSGFSTFSKLAILSSDSTTNQPTSIHTTQCTIKFDTWEEVYHLTKLDGQATSMTLKDPKIYRHRCLTAEISDGSIYAPFVKNGGTVDATLQLKQISHEKSEEIRNWLIQQQSGVIQGLFSHMLGDLNLTDQISIRVHIPPYSQSSSPRKKVNILYPFNSPMRSSDGVN